MAYNKSAFTIVELLVVIVVIGILATITVVSYSGISQKASLASLQSDLANAANKLKAYQAIYGSYPTLDASNCPSAPAVDVNYCLKFSPSSSIATTPFAGYVVNNTTTPKTFSLTLTNNDRQGVVTESSKPSILTPAPLDPVADWIATPQGDHYGNYYDPVSKSWATVTRSTPKTIYDPATQHIYDVPANYLAINPWSAYQPGGNGSAAVIEEARTNYLVNSYGAVNDGVHWSGWSYYSGLAGSPTREIVKGVYGDSALRWRHDNTPQIQNIYFEKASPDNTFAPGESATGSVWLKGSINGPASAQLILVAYSSTGWVGIATSPTLSLTDSWVRHSYTYSNLPTGTIRVGFRLNVPIATGANVDITFDAAQLEKGAFVTSYIPTTTTTVTRNTDAVTMPTVNWEATKGTFMATTYHKNLNAGPQTQYLLTWKPNTTNGIEAYLRNDLAASYLTTRKDGALAFDVKTGLPAGAFVYGGRWAVGEIVRAFCDGDYSTIRSDAYSLPTGAFPNTASVGINALDLPLNRIAIYDKALSDSQIVSLNSLIDGP